MRLPRPNSALLSAALPLAVAWLVLTVIQAILVGMVANAVASLAASDALRALVRSFPHHQVHLEIALGLLSAAHAPRLALDLPGSDWLVAMAPSLLVDHDTLGRPGWIGLAFADTSSPVAIHLSRMLANVTLIGNGALLTWVVGRRLSIETGGAWRRLAAWLLLLSQAYGIASQLAMSWSTTTGGGMALLLLSTKVLELESDTLWDLLDQAPLPVGSAIMNLLVVATVYGGLLALRCLADTPRLLLEGVLTAPAVSAAAARGISRVTGRLRRINPLRALAAVSLAVQVAGLVSLWLGVHVTLSAAPAFGMPFTPAPAPPWGALAAAGALPLLALALLRRRRDERPGARTAAGGRGHRKHLQLAATTLAAVTLMWTPLRASSGIDGDALLRDVQPAAIPDGDDADQAPPDGRPSAVVIERTSEGYRYLVNGEPEVIRGVGYNTSTRKLPADERSETLERDFGLMSDAGFNTIVGWEASEFDAVLMAKAADAGLGVIVPLDLRADVYYDRADRFNAMRDRITAWVRQHRDEPALRMWGLGNETLQGIQETDTPRARQTARFIVEMADYIHSLDPNHPVVYRDAEDFFVSAIAKALQESPRPRPWLVYGMNIYQPLKLARVLSQGPAAALGQPLMLSEFGPAGVHGRRRDRAYVEMWETLRQYPDTVLGGCAYTWSQNGPEPLDLLFGLTGPDGQPNDRTLLALSEAFDREDADGP